MSKVVIVTGASSGIGRHTASALSDMGCVVYDFSRRHIPNGSVKYVATDVTSEQNVASSVSAVVGNEGRVDAVINCAGFGISGAVEFTDLKDAKRQFDVNFFGRVK